MDDVVEQGEPERPGPPRWLRGAAVAVAVALALLVLTRTDLLSARPPGAAPGSPTAPPAGTSGAPMTGVVVRAGDHLERYDGAGRHRLATLPEGLPRRTPLVHAAGPDGSGPLVAVNQTVLFRASATSGRAIRSIGRAERVIAPSRTPNGLYVVQSVIGRTDVRVIEVDGRTGDLVDDEPFPAAADGGGWRATDVVTVGAGRSALLLTRGVARGHAELALAWDRDSVRSQAAPRLLRFGVTGTVLGTTDGRIVTLPEAGTCRGEACRLTVVSVTEDRTFSRTVDPPPGWLFGAGFAVGDRGDPVVGVARAGEPASLALARLVAGGRRALLVPGSLGVVPAVPPIGGPDGSVVFAVAGRGVTPEQRQEVRLAAWGPDDPREAPLLAAPALPAGAELVCVCR